MMTSTYFPEILNISDCPESTTRLVGCVQEQVAHDLSVVVHSGRGHSKCHWNFKHFFNITMEYIVT